MSLDTVGPTFGAQIIRNAIYAIIISFPVIILYLSIRFEYKLALPALLSVIHDVWLTLAIYSVTGREITSATVAAILTILGYSLYDVVIVFDRIRENVPLMRSSTYRKIVNRSVHETLTRSIITSLTTLVPVAVLYLFGGDTLKDFAFALLVGHPLRRPVLDRHRRAHRRAVEGARARGAQAAQRGPRATPRPAVAADADVVDVEVLARAEAALDASMGDERGERYETLIADEAADERAPRRAARAAPTREPEPAPEPGPARALGPTTGRTTPPAPRRVPPTPTPEAGRAARRRRRRRGDEPPAPGVRRGAAPTARRHRQVQKKRRR